MVLSVPSLAVAESYFPLRGDQGPLTQFQPHAALWLSEDRILMSDIRFNNLQIFDTQGRRFRIFDAATNKGPAQFVGLSQLGPEDFLALGSHYHEKNHPRFQDMRSRLHRFTLNLEKEELNLDDFKSNLSPQEPLRYTRMWGATPLRQLEFCGLDVNQDEDIAWFGLTRPLSEEGNLLLLRCSLKSLLENDERLRFTEVDTGFKLPAEERCQRPTYLTDLKVLDDGSILLLLSADDVAGKRFCTNSLWRWVPGGVATLVKKDLAAENRATGMALRSLGGGQYKVALVCDNAYDETSIPPRLVILEQVLKIH